MKTTAWYCAVAALVLAGLAGGERWLRADVQCDGSQPITDEPCSYRASDGPLIPALWSCEQLEFTADCEGSSWNRSRVIPFKCRDFVGQGPRPHDQCATSSQYSGICYMRYPCRRDDMGNCYTSRDGEAVRRWLKFDICDALDPDPPPPGGGTTT